MHSSVFNPGAVIIDGHGRADLGVVRALGERGVPVYLLTDDRHSPVAFSRFVTRAFSFPPADASEEERIAALTELGRQFLHKPVLFCTGDSSLVFLSRHRNSLERYYRHHLSAPELVANLNDKIGFAELASRLDLDVPFTLAPKSLAELEAALDRFTYPVVVKPAEKRFWARHAEIYALTKRNIKGIRLETPSALVEFYRSITRYDSRLVVQDYVEGRDEEIFSLHAFVDRHGELIGSFTGQKLRTYPIHRGIGCFQRSVWNAEAAKVGERALKTLSFTGHAVVNLKRDRRTGAFKIFEINARYSSWAYLHTYAGVNLPYAAYRDSLGEKQRQLPRQREGMRWVDAGRDLRALIDYRRVGEWSLRDWALSYFGRNCYAFFAWNDPLPCLLPVCRVLPRVVFYPLRWTRRHLAAALGNSHG
jgi:D-aspartate ligase